VDENVLAQCEIDRDRENSVGFTLKGLWDEINRKNEAILDSVTIKRVLEKLDEQRGFMYNI
jgi:hypothetical protein